MTRQQLLETIQAATVAMKTPPGHASRDPRFLNDSQAEIFDGVISAWQSHLSSPSNTMPDAPLSAALLELGNAFAESVKDGI